MNDLPVVAFLPMHAQDRKSTRLNSSHSQISYAVFCLKKKKKFYSNSLLTSTKAIYATSPIVYVPTSTINPSTRPRSCLFSFFDHVSLKLPHRHLACM